VSSDFVIRPIDPERDAAGVVEVIHEVFPSTTTAETWQQQYASIPARAQHRAWVAIVGDEVAGLAQASLNAWSDTRTAFAGVSVRRALRRRGIGTALSQHADAHLRELAPSRVLTSFTETPEGVAFAHAHGFAEVRAEALAFVDPNAVDFSPLDEAEVELVPLRALRPEDVYEVDMITTPDVPMTDQVDDMAFDEWVETIWRRPTITLDGSFAAVDGRLASFTMLAVNLGRQRGFNEYTCTLLSHRGRGLAALVKLASLRWARDHGVREVWTTNDETNAPMLAVNSRLGYETRLRRVEYLRDR
jgi:GNAT superfamily N-acetyltransferase